MDVFTFPKFRGNGYGKELIGTVLNETDLPTYLICRSELQPYYESMGFEHADVPPAYMQKRLQRIDAIAGKLLKRIHLIMVKDKGYITIS